MTGTACSRLGILLGAVSCGLYGLWGCSEFMSDSDPTAGATCNEITRKFAPCIGGAPGTGGGAPIDGSRSKPAFGFFILSDSHVSGKSSSLSTAIGQMRSIDSAPIAALSDGDFTNSATPEQWDAHVGFISKLFDPTATEFGGTKPRYLGVLGNHDIRSPNWYAAWSNHLSGQKNVGHSGTDGIYYSLTYQNTLFVVRDSNHVSDAAHSYADAQTTDLAATLQDSTAQFKFLFFHAPVYSCNTVHAGFAAGLPWIDLAEKYRVDVVFSGHTHVYSRTCPMKGAKCTTDGTGIVQVETGTVGGTRRPLDVVTATVSGTNSKGLQRSDHHNCADNLVVAAQDCSNDFCYVKIAGCRATINCYTVEVGNTTPFDSWTIDHC